MVKWQRNVIQHTRVLNSQPTVDPFVSASKRIVNVNTLENWNSALGIITWQLVVSNNKMELSYVYQEGCRHFE